MRTACLELLDDSISLSFSFLIFIFRIWKDNEFLILSLVLGEAFWDIILGIFPSRKLFHL